MLNINKPKHASRGFTLQEILLTVLIISILAGMLMITVGSASNRAEATKIMAELDTAKTALLTFSMENARRNVDPLAVLASDATGNLARNAIEEHLERSMDYKLRTKFTYRAGAGGIRIGFADITDIDSGVMSVLAKMAAEGTDYSWENNSIFLRVK